jgi:phenylacetyl-CoA:acceptor oxidoreductase 26-kDa subunit
MASVIGRIAPWRQSAWDWRAAGNFIGGGSGSGMLLIAAPLAGPAYPALTLLGMGLVCAGLLCVWAEIGRPWRALNVFRHARTSWMTREALLAPFVFAAGCGAVAFGAWPFPWITAALALAYLYCQARMLNAGRGIPAWRHAQVVPLILITGCTEGAGWCVLTLVLLQPSAMPGWLPWLLAAVLIARLLLFASYRRALVRTGAPRKALAVLKDFERPLIALDVAAAILVIGGAQMPAAGWLMAIAGLLAVLAGWALKLTIVVRAAFNQGFALPQLPDRGFGSIRSAVQPGWQGPP